MSRWGALFFQTSRDERKNEQIGNQFAVFKKHLKRKMKWHSNDLIVTHLNWHLVNVYFIFSVKNTKYKWKINLTFIVKFEIKF